MTKIFYVSTSSSKTKKKPGWKQEQEAHDAWLKSLKSMTLGHGKTVKKTTKKISPVVDSVFVDENRIHNIPKSTGFGVATKKVDRPEITHKDNPEMLKRELEAKSKKFMVAPAYNKGGDQLMTEEMLKDLKSGLLRRRV